MTGSMDMSISKDLGVGDRQGSLVCYSPWGCKKSLNWSINIWSQIEEYHPVLFICDSSGKEPACQCRRHKTCWFNSWVGKIPWRWAWEFTPIFLPAESHGQRSLAGYIAQGVAKSWTWLKWLSMHTHVLHNSSVSRWFLIFVQLLNDTFRDLGSFHPSFHYPQCVSFWPQAVTSLILK